VYLTASPENRVARIVKREGEDLAAVTAFTAERDRQDHDRYVRIYNIDNDNYNFADIVIDTDNIIPDQIAQLIIDSAEKIN
jgi:cytidylate kinase